MITRLLGLAGALLLAACGTEGNESWPPPSPALWQVTAPSGETGWLFGTVHAMPSGLEWRTPALDTVQGQAGVLLVEIADPGGAGGQELFAALSQSRGLPPLSTRIPETSRAGLDTLMERSGTVESDYTLVETWAAALMLAAGASAGDPTNGADRALIAEAREVRTLETRAGQLRMFDSLPETEQVALLVNAVEEARAADPQAALRAWLVGDMDALGRQAQAGLLARPHLRGTLLTARNAAWIGPISAAIDRGERPLVAVGAVHMAGADGLPALLASRGYRVERVQ